jgi:hypothetical protein
MFNTGPGPWHGVWLGFISTLMRSMWFICGKATPNDRQNQAYTTTIIAIQCNTFGKACPVHFRRHGSVPTYIYGNGLFTLDSVSLVRLHNDLPPTGIRQFATQLTFYARRRQREPRRSLSLAWKGLSNRKISSSISSRSLTPRTLW